MLPHLIVLIFIHHFQQDLRAFRVKLGAHFLTISERTTSCGRTSRQLLFDVSHGVVGVCDADAPCFKGNVVSGGFVGTAGAVILFMM